MENNANFDELARKAIASNGAMEDLDNLYSAVFALSDWHFIARGEFPDVLPYIAANAEYADGQYMVRAFTDTERLQRFAKANNLTEADGSALILSIPTGKAVEYLEQFIAGGVHGVWFNSDTESDGFFVPLRQLRPIKEHLAKINPPPVAASMPAKDATKPALETVLVAVRDGLALTGFVSRAAYACNFFCRVPAVWIEDGKMKAEYLERIYEKVYGADWRLGNDDGSAYVVLSSNSEMLTPETVKNTKWSGMENTPENQFWFYIANDAGEIRNVTAEEFQADVDAEFNLSAAGTK
jgi:hypothetical protein